MLKYICYARYIELYICFGAVNAFRRWECITHLLINKAIPIKTFWFWHFFACIFATFYFIAFITSWLNESTKFVFLNFFLIKNFLWLWRLTYIQLNLLYNDFKNRKTSPFYVVCAQIRWCKVTTQVWLECYKAKIIYVLHKLSMGLSITLSSQYIISKKRRKMRKKRIWKPVGLCIDDSVVKPVLHAATKCNDCNV